MNFTFDGTGVALGLGGYDALRVQAAMSEPTSTGETKLVIGFCPLWRVVS